MISVGHMVCASMLLFAQEQPPQGLTIIHGNPVSLRDMTNEADLIVLADVKKIAVGRATKMGKGVSFTISERIVELDVQRTIKGQVMSGKLLVSMYAPLPLTTKEGDRVLWYLPKPSRIGFTYPFGGSGNFTVCMPPGETHHSVLSEWHNLGLWGEKTSLWKEGALDRAAVKKLVEESCTPERTKIIMERADAPYQAEALSLEFVIAATKYYMQHPK